MPESTLTEVDKSKVSRVYCFDASAWLDCWVRWYPIGTFPSLWRNLDRLVDQGKLITPEMVLDELSNVEDGIAAYIRSKPLGICKVDPLIQNSVRQVMERHRNLVETRGKSGGDPWVIATAHVYKMDVVTGEKRSRNLSAPRIPDVCDSFNIRVFSTLEFICSHGWEF